MQFVITYLAQKYFEDLLVYSLDTWGELQMKSYRAKITSLFEKIQRHPAIGSVYENASNIRQKKCGQHVVFYRYGEVAIEVLRILDQRMKATKHLS